VPIVNASTTDFVSRGPVAFFTINRPEAGNAMTWEMYDALVLACERVDADSGLRAFVIRAAGGVFCTGTDISQFAAFSRREDGLEYERRLESAVARIERVNVPTIAQVEGIAAGAGCAIALACDLRVCSPLARFGVPIARTLGNGLSLENCARLAEYFGMARTETMLITGGFVDATEAAACGVVTRLADPADVERTTADLAEVISRNAPLTIRAAKKALGRLSARNRSEAGEVADLVADCYASADFREGVSAFLSKRKPKFTGR
jgi:enoyl-CoA hydratase/carnithine racemase